MMIAPALPVPVKRAPPPATSSPVRQLINLWLSQLAEASRRTYITALEDFAGFVRLDVEAAVDRLLGNGRQAAKVAAIGYQSDMLEGRGLSPATINVRIAALRSLLAAAEDLGMIDWLLRIKAVKGKALRDTRGPGRENVRLMMERIDTGNTAKHARDVAILRCLFDLGLRRSEVVNLDVEHFDGACLWILGKGHREREPLTLPQQTKDAIDAWITHRGDHAGPLFISLSNNARGRRLTGQAVYDIVRGLGMSIDIKTSPHRLRHTSITTACEVADQAGVDAITGGQKFARHSDPATTMIYRDGLEDVQGKVAQAVASSL